MEEHSPEYAPQANESAEVCVSLLKGHFLTVRSCIESRLGHLIPVRHLLIAWMIRHAASLITWCAKGHDEQTAYQRVRSRQFRTRLMTFGEMCRLKVRNQEPTSVHPDGRRWHSGVFVGIDRRTGQYIIYSDDQVRLAKTVVRDPRSTSGARSRCLVYGVRHGTCMCLGRQKSSSRRERANLRRRSSLPDSHTSVQPIWNNMG